MRRTADDRRAALQRGAEAEEAVCARYERDGWRVIGRNVRVGGAELDLVVERSGVLRFVEVKQRDPDDPFGLEAIHADKQRRLARGARAFLQTYDDVVEEATFDVVLVRLEGEGYRFDVFENAFDAG